MHLINHSAQMDQDYKEMVKVIVHKKNKKTWDGNARSLAQTLREIGIRWL